MPVQLISDKYLRAERRNRLEKSRLDVRYKHYDRETTRLNFEIDREKRIIRKSFRNVAKTSGASDAGVPPKNEKDTDFEKCPSYRQGLRLSNKRLLEWRECEKQLEKFIQNHESEMAKSERRRLVSAKSTKSEKKNVVNGFDPDREALNDEVFLDDDALSTVTSVNPMDVLRDDPEHDNEDFNVKNWEKNIIESYKKMVTRTVSAGSSDKKGNTNNTLRSKSSPAIITTELNVGTQRRRPHTAQARRRPRSGKSLPPRPSSAQVSRNNDKDSKQFIITKDSIFIRTGQKYEKLVDNRPVETPVLVNNYLDTLTPGSSSLLNSSLSSVNSLCPVQEGDEEDGQNEDEAHTSETDKESQHAEEFKQSNNELLKKAVKKWRRKKSERLSSASGLSDSKSHVSLLHSNSDLSSYVESIRRLRHDSTFKQTDSEISTHVESGGRTRHDSESASSRISLSSLLPTASLGIPADIKDFSHEQEKLVSKVSAERPVATNKLVAVTSVVKAAMKFSRTARKRLLANMIEENSTDPHEIIRQERLRRVQSRQSVLNSIANQWSDNAAAIIEAVE